MDKDSFVREMDAHGGMMFRTAYSLLRNSEDCKDAMQEAALKAWEMRGRLRDESKLTPWLMRILINACRDTQRKRKRVVPVDTIPDTPVPPEDPTLRLIIDTLPEKLRLPLVLSYAEGMDYQEIAETLQLTQTAVRGRIHRAKKELRKELEV